MRLGLSSPLAHRDAEEWAQQMAALGCGAVVFPLDCRAEDREIESYVKAAGNYDLIIAEVGIWRNVLALDEKEREDARAYAVGQLRLAERIGARCCVNISGNAGGKCWDGGSRENFSEECRKEVIQYTRELIDEVKPVKTKYSIEPMPWMIPTGPDDYLQLMREVDREAFGMHLDFVNMINCPERYFFSDDFMQECFDKLGPYIESCHMKDIFLRDDLTFQLVETFCGNGTVNLEKYCRLINQYDPDMPVIIEHLNTDREYLDSLSYVKGRLERAGIPAAGAERYGR